MVGRRGETPLVPPYILCNFKLDGAVPLAPLPNPPRRGEGTSRNLGK